MFHMTFVGLGRMGIAVLGRQSSAISSDLLTRGIASDMLIRYPALLDVTDANDVRLPSWRLADLNEFDGMAYDFRDFVEGTP